METSFITSQSDIKRFLKTCHLCDKITNGSKNVIDHSELPNIILNNGKAQKHAFIIHVQNNIPSSVGHWASVLVFNNKYALICDGLNQIKHNQNGAMININHFCSLNRLKPVILKFRCQPKRSLKCGYIALFFVAKATTLSFNSFNKMCKMLNQYSILTKERYALNFVKRHYNKPFL